MRIESPCSPGTRVTTPKHTGSDEYGTDERFDPGTHLFTMADKTVLGEPLEKTFSGELPRPAGQDGQWYWPPSGSRGANADQPVDPTAKPALNNPIDSAPSPERKANMGLLLALLGAPVLLVVGGLIVVLIVARGQSKASV